jgi:hypothetical protein
MTDVKNIGRRSSLPTPAQPPSLYRRPVGVSLLPTPAIVAAAAAAATTAESGVAAAAADAARVLAGGHLVRHWPVPPSQPPSPHVPVVGYQSVVR